ncbi:hypothetical protein [Streptomyces lasiicapitis]|uniref:Uncharacterized protein n=1 Tax=Streptomyces lasiicapitis TaxID=1923961 RepID=A0ABQ2MVL8_9ACTN|nr:hypothetical protein [Streptomyces lasiicapitis]GGO58800.1 hypothetical protein GCM10012286_78920 [Streptomyces lasiicapitis]
MSTLCNHRRPDHHSEGETCRYARDLKPGDKVGVLSGAQATVRDAHPAADHDGYTSVLLDVSWDGPALIAADTILPVRPLEGLTHDELPEPEPEVEVQVRLEITEECAYDFTTTVTVPVSAAASEEALHSHLDDNWGAFIEAMDDEVAHGNAAANEQSLDRVRIEEREATA